MKNSISEATKASYRLHARRWGVRRMATLMRKRGFPIDEALETLVGRRRGNDYDSPDFYLRFVY